MKEWQGWGIDGHSEAYATLADFANHDWWGQYESYTFNVWMNEPTDETQEGVSRNTNGLAYRIEMLNTQGGVWGVMQELQQNEHVKSFSIYSEDTHWPDADSECVWDHPDGDRTGNPAITRTVHVPHGDGKFSEVIKMMAKMLSHVEGGDLESVRAFWWYDN
jgi:hypothetical protein